MSRLRNQTVLLSSLSLLCCLWPAVNGGLTVAQTFAIPADIAQELKRELVEISEFRECPNFRDNFQLTKLDLNQDNRPEFIVHGLRQCLCSPTGNCSFWIYQRTPKGPKLLLSTHGVQRFKFKKSRSKGFLDLVTSMHDSATSSEVSLYRFNGEVYEIFKVWAEEYEYPDSEGNMKIWKRPRIVPCD